jgi:hypothetical protein
MAYIKRGAILFAIFLFTVSIVLAAHSASVTTDYAPIYETTSGNFSITVSNGLLSANSINNVSAALDGFSILSTVALIGWQPNSAGNVLSFFTSDHKISNWGAQTFGFEIRAGNVDQNQTADWPVTTYDTAGETDMDTLQVLILNDYTAPIVSNVLPFNGSFVKKGTTSQQFSLDAVDPETGVASVAGKYGLCDNLSDSLSFTKTNDSYLATKDLSAYDDSTVLCYEYDAQSNGGEIAAVLGQFTIDGVPPAVSLLYPDNGVFMNNNSLFQFSATDNLAPTITCALYSDAGIVDSIVINNGDAANASVADVPEGQHKWNVTCTDLAGNSGASETRTFTLDKTPPAINVTSPASGTVNKAGVPVDVTVTDNYAVASIWYEFQNNTYANITSPFSINTDSAEDGENLIIIHATDSAGNEAVLNYMMIVDKKAPSIDLSLPEGNSTVDVHVPFIMTVTDNYDPLLDCSVIADGDEVARLQAQNGNVTTATVLIKPGMKTIIVRCEDDAENAAQTDARIVDIQDLSGPDIIIDEIQDVTRGEKAVFNVNITDVSGIASADAVLALPGNSTETITLTPHGGIYTGEYQTTNDSAIGTYTLTVTATDASNASNQNSAAAEFEVINSYVVTLDVTSPVYEGNTVTVTGTAARDDGASISGNVDVALPKDNVTLPIDNNAFSTTFKAPSKGTYEIKAWITVGNREFSATKNLEVKRKSSGGSGGGGGGSGGGHVTVAMPQNEGGNAGILEEVSEPEEVVVEETKKEEPVTTPVETQPDSGDTGNIRAEGVGVGKASGFFNLDKLSWNSLLWIILGILAVIAIIKMLSGRNRDDNFNFSEMERYLKTRKRNSRE